MSNAFLTSRGFLSANNVEIDKWLESRKQLANKAFDGVSRFRRQSMPIHTFRPTRTQFF